MDELEPMPGKGSATASMVLGIISLVAMVTGYGALISMVLGIVGLVMANKAKKEGFEGGQRTAGFIMSLIGVILGGIVFVSCIACACIGAAAIGSMDPNELQQIADEFKNLPQY